MSPLIFFRLTVTKMSDLFCRRKYGDEVLPEQHGPVGCTVLHFNGPLPDTSLQCCR